MFITYKLECTLRLNAENADQDVAVDVIQVKIPDNLTDEETTAFFNNVRQNIKRKYQEQINTYFDVVLKEAK